MVYDTSTIVTATTTVWYEWNSGTATNSNATTWMQWQGVTNTSAITSTAWIAWNVSRAKPLYTSMSYPKPKPISEEETQRLKVEQERREAEEKKCIEAAKFAEVKARKLLVEHLDEDQAKLLEKEKKFHVTGQDGKRYEVDATKRMHNVFELTEDGQRCVEYCIYQTGATPQSDHLLCQKMLLESDIETFKRVANKWDLQRGRQSLVRT